MHCLDITENCKVNSHKYFSMDLTDLSEISRLDERYDMVFHCAGSPSVPNSVKHPLDDFSVNVKGALNILDFVRLSGCKKFIFLSTVSVFDQSNKLPLTEKSLKRPMSPYGAAKLAIENYCLAYFRSYGTDTMIARIFNTFGPKMNHLFVADMLKKIKSSKNEITIGGDGNQIRDYVYISDLINALDIIAQKGDPGEDYNICSGKKILLNDIVKLMLTKMGKTNLDIIYDGKSYAGDISEWYGNSRKLRKLGFQIRCNFEDGLEKILETEKKL